MTTTTQQVNADIRRMMAPTLRPFIVTVNYRDEVEVMASSEDNAIDRVLMDIAYDVRVLSCNNLEVIV
jgi:hypothetical protein